MHRKWTLLIAMSVVGQWGLTCEPPPDPPGQCEQPSDCAMDWLAGVMDQYHRTADVYTDSDAAGNHFSSRGRLSSVGDEDAIPPMDEAWTDGPRRGPTAIKAQFLSEGDNWGGWYFMNGVLQGSAVSPDVNWGAHENAGLDLTGAGKLTFWVRGAVGGERVEFFAFGVGRHAQTGVVMESYPDSSPKVSTGVLTLSSQWTERAITVSNSDLSYVLGGFGWVASSAENAGSDITFFLDDIRYDRQGLDQPRLLVSYETGAGTDFDRVMRNVAFTYDNALAAIALVATGHAARARLIVDALVYAHEHDRFYADHRLRNAYQAGDLMLPPGWAPNGRLAAARMPGWYEPTLERWVEDQGQVSTHTGNVAWAMLAVLAYYTHAGGDEYLDAASNMGEWIETNCRDARGAGGYTGGFEGWEPAPLRLSWKSTEHNIDLYAAFQRLHVFTGEAQWQERADHARQFLLAMWDADEGKFWTGTGDDGVTINKAVVPTDVQAWAVLALRSQGQPYWQALSYAEQHMKVGGGFDFNEDRDGVWYEGTAQMALAYHEAGHTDKVASLVEFLSQSQLATGALHAASKDGLTTGFTWKYFARPHVGATAWFVLAANNANPFWLGDEAGPR